MAKKMQKSRGASTQPFLSHWMYQTGQLIPLIQLAAANYTCVINWIVVYFVKFVMA